MAPLRPLSYREVKRRLEAAGFAIYSQRGSHVKFVREDPDGLRTVIVPAHREIAVGTPSGKLGSLPRSGRVYEVGVLRGVMITVWTYAVLKIPEKMGLR